MNELLSQWMSLAIPIIGLIVWLVRLEGRVNYGEKMNTQLSNDLSALEAKHENLDSKIVQELARLRESVARIEGLLSQKPKE